MVQNIYFVYTWPSYKSSVSFRELYFSETDSKNFVRWIYAIAVSEKRLKSLSGSV